MLDLILLLSKSFLRDAKARRMMMFYGVLSALVLLFLGSTFLDAWLRARPLYFLGFWVACACLTLFSVLLALFDLLLVRAESRAEKRRMAEEIRSKSKSETVDGNENAP